MTTEPTVTVVLLDGAGEEPGRVFQGVPRRSMIRASGPLGEVVWVERNDLWPTYPGAPLATRQRGARYVYELTTSEGTLHYRRMTS